MISKRVELFNFLKKNIFLTPINNKFQGKPVW